MQITQRSTVRTTVTIEFYNSVDLFKQFTTSTKRITEKQ
jgi:hypothetical protein